ncbi:MAG: phosphotransferase [Chloroflexi bacterium]|nr:phosphotransferase [Chloroflexota bacterium]
MDMQPLIERFLPLYLCDPHQPPLLLRVGIDNDLYVFTRTNGRKAVLRLSKRNITDTIDFEAKLAQHLFEQGAPVAQILPTVQGELWTVIDLTTIVAFDFIPGAAFPVEHEHKPDPPHTYAAGEALGKIHQAGLSFTFEHPNRRTIFTEFERALAKSATIAKLEGWLNFIATLQSYQQWAQAYLGDVGLIHNDYIPSNLLFEGKSISAVVDFDWACHGPLIKDLGIALATWSAPDGLVHHWPDVFEAFLAGYNQSAPKKLAVNKALYQWICFSCLSDACTFFADLAENVLEITHVLQCRRYKKFIYFENFV